MQLDISPYLDDFFSMVLVVIREWKTSHKVAAVIPHSLLL
jgi:hypothetical protein